MKKLLIFIALVIFAFPLHSANWIMSITNNSPYEAKIKSTAKSHANKVNGIPQHGNEFSLAGNSKIQTEAFIIPWAISNEEIIITRPVTRTVYTYPHGPYAPALIQEQTKSESDYVRESSEVVETHATPGGFTKTFIRRTLIPSPDGNPEIQENGEWNLIIDTNGLLRLQKR